MSKFASLVGAGGGSSGAFLDLGARRGGWFLGLCTSAGRDPFDQKRPLIGHPRNLRVKDRIYPETLNTADLTAGESRVHTTGPVWRTVRASVAIPGIFPPIRADDGHVLVDGGVLDNLPVDTMRATFTPGTVIAVDLGRSSALQASDLPEDGVVSGWQVAASRFRPRHRTRELPGIMELLSATSSVTGRHQADHADRLLSPPVHTYGVLDFAANERIIDIGYRHTRDALKTWQPLPGV